MQHRARIFLEGLHMDGFMTLLLPWYNHMMREVALKRILSAALSRSTADTSGLCARFATCHCDLYQCRRMVDRISPCVKRERKQLGDCPLPIKPVLSQ